jgi:pimeloyl-ACP methyl ester carboxylesterase
VTFDQLGTGRSEVPPEAYCWSMEAAVADVDAEDRLGEIAAPTLAIHGAATWLILP